MTDMKKSRFTEEQIIGYLRQAEAGIQIASMRITAAARAAGLHTRAPGTAN
jgi:hypothetical protein